MSYYYFDHEADMGIIGRGNTMEEAFQEGAKAMLALIYKSVNTAVTKQDSLSVEEKDLESLWISFLNGLLSKMDIQNVFIASCCVENILRVKGVYFLKGILEVFPRSQKVEIKSEVKAATYCEVSVIEKEGYCEVRCVVDL